MFSNYDLTNPSCFGKGTQTENCVRCRFYESCRFAAEDDLRTGKQDDRWKFNSCEFMDNIAPKQEGCGLPVDLDDDRLYSRDEVVALSAFLLRIGHDRKLGKIIHEKLMGARSFAEIARKEGVTRQAIHKRIGKQLAKLLGFKNRRLTDSRLISLNVREFELLKLTRAGFTDEEIQEELGIPPRALKQLRERMEWKLIHPT